MNKEILKKKFVLHFFSLKGLGYFKLSSDKFYGTMYPHYKNLIYSSSPDILCSHCYRLLLPKDLCMHLLNSHGIRIGKTTCVWCMSYTWIGRAKIVDDVHRIKCLTERRLQSKIKLKTEELILEKSLTLRELEVITECSEQTIRDQAALLAEKEEELHEKNSQIRRLQNILMEYLYK